MVSLTILCLFCVEKPYSVTLTSSEWLGRVIKKTLRCDETASCIRFSPDISSSFLTVVTGTKKCFIFGTQSFEVVQEIFCRSSTLNTLCFDPSGTILAIGGETRSLGTTSSGVVLVVRVGELLHLGWFCRGRQFADPELLCSKLSSLSSIERAQILFHRSIEDERGDHSHFPLESRIRIALTSKQDDGGEGSLGSSVMSSEPQFDQVLLCLRGVLSHFPQTVFAGVPGYGNMFGVLLHDRDSPRLLRLLFYVVLKTCRSYPYLAMNEDMRNGTISKALIASCDVSPEMVLDVVLSMVLWPASVYSTKDGNWRVPTSEPVFG